jgi:DNA-binding response OmpR family regulator
MWFLKGGRDVKRLLLADDDTNVVEVLRVNLEADGYEVVVAYDGDTAWTRLTEGGVDLAIVDVMMPGRDGLDLLAAVRDNPPTHDLPVVLLTARASDEEIWAGWQAGANYYLTKPFDIDQLLEYLRYLTGEDCVSLPR